MHWVFVTVCGLSLDAEGRGYALVLLHGLLSMVPSFVVEHGLWACKLHSVLASCGLDCSMACGIFLDQGSNWCPLPRKADSQY